jgi:hypothetical protein
MRYGSLSEDEHTRALRVPATAAVHSERPGSAKRSNRTTFAIPETGRSK